MPQSKATVTSLIKDQLSGEVAAQSIICWYNKVFEAGETIRAGPQQLKAPFRATLVFVDEQPKANWGHPCQYLFISDDGAGVKAFDAQYPPFMEAPPPEYSVLLRYGQPPANDREFSPY